MNFFLQDKLQCVLSINNTRLEAYSWVKNKPPKTHNPKEKQLIRKYFKTPTARAKQKGEKLIGIDGQGRDLSDN